MEELSKTIVQLSDVPQDIAFKNAVENYSKAKALHAFCTKIIEGLDEIAPEI